MCPFPFVRVLLTMRLPLSGQYLLHSVVLAVKPYQTVMSIGTGGSGSLRMPMREPQAAAIKRERLPHIRIRILTLIPQTLRLVEELVS